MKRGFIIRKIIRWLLVVSVNRVTTHWCSYKSLVSERWPVFTIKMLLGRENPLWCLQFDFYNPVLTLHEVKYFQELIYFFLFFSVARQNNWPPLPEKCCVGPCFYQDITVDIPLEFQKVVRAGYYLWMCKYSYIASFPFF